MTVVRKEERTEGRKEIARDGRNKEKMERRKEKENDDWNE